MPVGAPAKPCYEGGMNRALIASLLVSLWLGLGSLAFAETRTAAVMPLGKGAGPAEFDGLGRALADMMVTDLSGAQHLQLVERMQLGLVLDELKLGKSGFLDKKSAQKLGRGVSAQLVITGSFTIISDRFVIDCRVIVVESGSVLASARSEGPLDDFIAIEKDVVEKLLSALDIKLSAGERRKLLVDAPTENLRALASYGRGVEAKEAGLQEAAQKAFEDALRKDPDFAKASMALRDLAVDTEKAQRKEQKRVVDDKERALEAALKALSAETTRAKGFKDTRASMLDFTIRQELLARMGRHCERYQELKHYLLRREGNFEGWFIGLRSTYQASWEKGSEMMDARAKQLGLVGPNTPYGTRPGELMFDASPDLTSGAGLLLSHNLSPEKFRSTVIAALTACHLGSVQMREFDELAKRAKGWSWIDSSLFTVSGEGPSTLSPRDSIDLYWAYLRAENRGVDGKVRARTDAVLARHPEGDAYRYAVLGRIEEVVSAGERFERNQAARMGRSEAELIAAATSVTKRDAKGLRLTAAVCDQLQKASESGTTRAHEYLRDPQNADRGERRDNALNNLALELAPLSLARCFTSDKGSPRSNKEILALVAKGLKRPHPAQLRDASCLEQSKTVRNWLADPSPSPALQYSMLRALQSLRHQRCLVP